MVKTNTAEDFRKLHDKSHIVPSKIADGLKKLGKDRWLYQADFMKLCGISNGADFNLYCVKFEKEHCVAIGGSKGKRAWAGSKSLADTLRTML